MELYFIRHAQSTNNRLYDETGADTYRSIDPALTETGLRQVAILAETLCQPKPADVNNGWNPQNREGFGLTHLYASLMLRALETADRVAQATGLSLHAWVDLHESGGLYLKDPETGEKRGQTGGNRAYFQERYPGLVLPDWLGEQGWWNRPFEERTERPVRAQRVLDELLARHGDTDDRVALISHGGFYNYFMAAVLHLPGQESLAFVLNNTAITRIDFHLEKNVLVYLNHCDFLPAELIT